MPRQIGRWIVGLELWGVVALTGLILVSAIRCYDDREQAQRNAVTRAYENGYKVALANLGNKQAKTDTVVKIVRVRGGRIDSVVARVDTVLASDTAQVPVLRETLALLRTEVVAYRGAVDSLIVALGEERLAAQAANLSASRLVGQLQAEVAAERKRRWRYRGEGAVVTSGVILLLLLL